MQDTLGKQLRALRKAKGWQLIDLTRQIGISVAYLSDIELDRRVPPVETLHRIASALDADFEQLILYTNRITPFVADYCNKQPQALCLLNILASCGLSEHQLQVLTESALRMAGKAY